MPRWFVVHTRLDLVACEQEYGEGEYGGLPEKVAVFVIVLHTSIIQSLESADK
jgi:hypothetical protein